MSNISTWDETAGGNNTGSPPDFAPENGTTIGSLNNIIRELQASVRRFYQNPDWRDLGDIPTLVSGTQFSVSGDQTAFYVIGQRVQMIDSSTLYGSISGVTLGANTTVTVVWDVGALAVPTQVFVGMNPAGNPSDFAPGVRMMFQQATAPSGWTKDVSAVYNESSPRIMTNFVGTGGSQDFASVFTSNQPTTTVGNHSHGVGSVVVSLPTATGIGEIVSGAEFYAHGTHVHTLSGFTDSAGSHNHTTNLAVKFTDFIICTKN